MQPNGPLEPLTPEERALLGLLDARLDPGHGIAASDAGRRVGSSEGNEAARSVLEFLSGFAAAESGADRPQTSLEPMVLGEFVLLREIGRGGMGIVYEAEQTGLQRRVAVKLLPFATRLDERRLQRFRHEAEACALLQHPHIAAVYTVGCERGLHFFAMELVDGCSLAKLIAELRDQRSANSTTRDISRPLHALGITAGAAARPVEQYRRIAALGAQFADALAFAHLQGIVHRDVKPSNLLVDNLGNARVVDFGVAQIEGKETVTASGDRVGTLRYMSPEQVRGQRDRVDGRSDVYSLAAALYELATLRSPFGEEDNERAAAAQACAEPPSAQRVEASVPTDLATILDKALRDEPDERYGSAAEMAEDLRRFAADAPITARTRTLSQRVLRLANKHRVAAGIGLVGLCGTVLVLAIAAIALREANLNESAAKQRADANLQSALQTVAGLWASFADRTPTPGDERRANLRKLMRQSLDLYESLLLQQPDDASLLIEAAKGYARQAELDADDCRWTAALQAHAREIALWRRLQAMPSASSLPIHQPGFAYTSAVGSGAPTIEESLGFALLQLAATQAKAGEGVAATATLEETLSFLQQARNGPGSHDWTRSYLASAWLQQAQNLSGRRSIAAAIESAERGVSLWEELLAEAPASARRNQWTAEARLDCARIRLDAGQPEAALVHLEAATGRVQALEAASEMGAQREALQWRLLYNRGLAERILGRNEAACATAQQATAQAEKVLDSKASQLALARLASSLTLLADLRASLGYAPAALRDAERSVEIWDRLLGDEEPQPYHSYRGEARMAQARALGMMGQREQACTALQQAMDDHQRILARVPGDWGPRISLLEAKRRMALHLIHMRQFERAEAVIRDAHADTESFIAQHPLFLSGYLRELWILAAAVDEQGRKQEAAELFDAAVTKFYAAWQQAPSEACRSEGSQLLLLAALFAKRSANPAQAEDLFRTLLELADDAPEGPRQGLAEIRLHASTHLLKGLVIQEQFAEAREVMASAVTAADAAAGLLAADLRLAHCSALIAWIACVSDASLRRPQDALRLSTRAYAVKPEAEEIARAMAAAWYRTGDSVHALELLQQLVKAKTVNPVTVLLLVMALHEQGRTTEARALLAAATQKLPPDDGEYGRLVREAEQLLSQPAKQPEPNTNR